MPPHRTVLPVGQSGYHVAGVTYQQKLSCTDLALHATSYQGDCYSDTCPDHGKDRHEAPSTKALLDAVDLGFGSVDLGRVDIAAPSSND